MQTLIIDKLGVNQNYYTFTLILLIKTVLCSQFPWTKFINYGCFDMRSSIVMNSRGDVSAIQSTKPLGGLRRVRNPGNPRRT